MKHWALIGVAAVAGCPSLAVGPTKGPGCQTQKTREVNVVKCGAKLDGSDDTAAFNAARSAAGPFGVVDVPKGVINAQVLTDPSRPVLWRLSGNKDSEGNPVIEIGTDTVETFYAPGADPSFGMRYLARRAAPGMSPLSVTRQDVAFSGGPKGVLYTQKAETYLAGTPGAHVWGFGSSMYDRSSNADGNNVALNATYSRLPGGRTSAWASNNVVQQIDNVPSGPSIGALIGTETNVFVNNRDAQNNRLAYDAVIGRYDRQFGLGDSYIGEAYAAYRASSAAYPDGSESPQSAFWKFGLKVDSGIGVAAIDVSGATYISAPIGLRIGPSTLLDFSTNGSRTLSWNKSGWAFQAAGLTTFGILDGGAIVVPEAMVPRSTSDPSGAIGEMRFSGRYMYRKTPSGWLRFVGRRF